MSHYIRIFFYILNGLLVFVFTYITFFSDQYLGLANIVEKTTPWLFVLQTESGSIVESVYWDDLQKQLENWASVIWFADKILLDKSSNFDSFYSSLNETSDYKRTQSGSIENIEIWLWEYYLICLS